MRLNINTDEVVKFTNKLEQMHRKHLPLSVRNTLNSAAFDVKQKTMPESANKSFVNRNKNFFKATSRVEMAKGFDVHSMSAKVGFVGGERNQAVRDLEQQEKGGKIEGRSFIPTDAARTGQSPVKMVAKRNRLNNINRIIDARKGRIQGNTPGQRFNKAVAKAGSGGLVLAPYKNEMYLWRVNSDKKTSDGKWKLTLLYTYKKGRSVKVDNTNFMRRATDKSSAKINQFFIREAKKQLG